MTIASPPAARRLVVTRATVLTPDGWVEEAVRIEDGRFAAIGSAGDLGQIDGTGLLLLPGIVDLHADAFERSLAPRPGVSLPLALALAENDAAVLAAGITTFFLSATDSFEPGIRSRATVRALIERLADPARALGSDTRLHLRHEVCQVDGHDELLGWLRAGRIQLLSWADHLPRPGETAKRQRFVRALVRRENLPEAEVEALIDRAAAERKQGWELLGVLAETARSHGIPCASHDDLTPAEVERSAALGVAISEFPQEAETARRAREHGAAVLMGAPNYVRGGSHLACLGVKEALDRGLCDALCSDYHYPSLFAAPFLMDVRGDRPLASAWKLVSEVPARLAGLPDKGRIAPGAIADFILVQPGHQPRLRAVYVAGREVARFS